MRIIQMDKKDLKDALREYNDEQQSFDIAFKQINRENLIITVFLALIALGVTENIITTIIIGILAYILLFILWSIPVISKIMTYLCSGIWALVCFAILFNLSVPLACIISILVFIISVFIHKGWTNY